MSSNDISDAYVMPKKNVINDISTIEDRKTYDSNNLNLRISPIHSNVDMRMRNPQPKVCDRVPNNVEFHRPIRDDDRLIKNENYEIETPMCFPFCEPVRVKKPESF